MVVPIVMERNKVGEGSTLLETPLYTAQYKTRQGKTGGGTRRRHQEEAPAVEICRHPAPEVSLCHEAACP